MINHKQFKLSVIIGGIIFGIQLLIGLNPHTGTYHRIHPVFALFKTELWYIPILYIILKFFVICAIIYLIFRVINYFLNYYRG